MHPLRRVARPARLCTKPPPSATSTAPFRPLRPHLDTAAVHDDGEARGGRRERIASAAKHGEQVVGQPHLRYWLYSRSRWHFGALADEAYKAFKAADYALSERKWQAATAAYLSEALALFELGDLALSERRVRQLLRRDPGFRPLLATKHCRAGAAYVLRLTS